MLAGIVASAVVAGGDCPGETSGDDPPALTGAFGGSMHAIEAIADTANTMRFIG